MDAGGTRHLTARLTASAGPPGTARYALAAASRPPLSSSPARGSSLQGAHGALLGRYGLGHPPQTHPVAQLLLHLRALGGDSGSGGELVATGPLPSPSSCVQLQLKPAMRYGPP